MSKELSGKREKTSVPRWMARIIGANVVTAALFIPTSTHSLNDGITSFNPGTTLEIPDDKCVLELDIEQPTPPPVYDEKTGLTRDTGIDMQPYCDFGVGGTDIGQPVLMEDGSVVYLFGDTFAVAGPFMENLPPGVDHYRAQTMLRSDMIPVEGQPIIFDSAVGIEGKGIAPETLGQWHILLNDGIGLPGGGMMVSYQHTIEVDDPESKAWHTDYSGLAYSPDGNHFELIGPQWENDASNSDPYQMWSMQRDGNWVYIVSVRAGRQQGPMMLFRAPWDQMLQGDSYEYWNGGDWGEKSDATPIMEGHFGEPSLRKLPDGNWALGYAEYARYPKLVTRKLLDPDTGPQGAWSEPKIQLTHFDLGFPYGPLIHPYSTEDNLILMISTWQKEKDETEHGKLIRYDVSHLIASL